MSTTDKSPELQHFWNILRSRSSVNKKLPCSWVECFDDATGYTYFYNSATGETQWERPSELESSCHIKGWDTESTESNTEDSGNNELGEVSPESSYIGWQAITSPDGSILYYSNYITGELLT
jgi:hypothetical protein